MEEAGSLPPSAKPAGLPASQALEQRPPSPPPVLQLRQIVKRFPGVLANDHIDLDLHRGEILAILGENGAGKTTLMNILYGLLPPDSGSIRVRGEEARFTGPADAIARGIGMVHQHFMLVPVMTVAENVMLGQEEVHHGFFLNREQVARKIADISQRYGLSVDPSARIEELPVGIQQRVEIVKLLYRQADILILDEPTAVLTPQEVMEFFRILRSLAAAGHSLLFITHKLKEALELADRIMVLRQGRVVGTVRPGEVNESTLAQMMVGREVELVVQKEPAHPGEALLEVENLWVENEQGLPAVRGVSLQVHAGEIVGVAGVEGNGQIELMEAIAGLRSPMNGTIRLGGQECRGATPRQLLERGVAYIPEDRQRDGLVLPFPIEDNLVLNTYYRAPASRRGWLDRRSIRQTAERLKELFDIRAGSVSTPVQALSGGNQQKVIVARELSRPIRLLLAVQPTRGLDVGSIEYIHQRIVQARDGGCGILIVSTELDEILALSDRIVVLFRGQVVGVLDAAEATRERLGLLMAGVAA
ncbi:MAG: ABC transporter ATP-binding protein [Limnochordaceae bacterium]|nr:ABC transporter ATP-binding protein [Limnochordaceae bacterium]